MRQYEYSSYNKYLMKIMNTVIIIETISLFWCVKCFRYIILLSRWEMVQCYGKIADFQKSKVWLWCCHLELSNLDECTNFDIIPQPLFNSSIKKMSANDFSCSMPRQICQLQIMSLTINCTLKGIERGEKK